MDQNECYHLEIDYKPFPQMQEMLDMQRKLQERIIPGFGQPLPLAVIAEEVMKQHIASREEEVEFLNSLGGTHDQGPRSGVWKWWKKDNKGMAMQMYFTDLSERDKIESKMEIVDRFHFLMNEMLLIGMTAEEFYSMYMAKNKENFKRQDNGY